MSITIRQFRPDDASGIADLYARYSDNPNPVTGGVSPTEIAAELDDRRTAAFFLAVTDEGTEAAEVVATFGLFRTNGRRTARPGELIADMFFVAPAYRNGVLTGNLFTQAITWMFESHFLVLRLTVNPANAVAFKLYRRVGCVSIGHPRPGEDGNVELYNFIPLVLRRVIGDLGPDGVAALRELSTFGCLTSALNDDLRSDVALRSGVPVVDYRLGFGAFRLEATVDVEHSAVVQAELMSPDQSRRRLRVRDVGRHPVPVSDAQHRFGGEDLECVVSGRDGTVEVFARGHFGPVLTSTWPSCTPGREAGWRESHPCELWVTPVPGGVRIVERSVERELRGTVTLVDGCLRQEFWTGAYRPRVFHTIGVRQAYLSIEAEAGGVAGSLHQHPSGLGLGVRDSSEIVAAGLRPPASSQLTWLSADRRLAVATASEDDLRLVHSALLDRRPHVDARGVASLVTQFTLAAAAPPQPEAVTPSVVTTTRSPAATGSDTPVPASQLRLEARAGGVAGWSSGGAKVLRSPFPRRLSHGCNPRWTAGMWLTAERTRHHRDQGLGWGVPTGTSWAPDPDGGLTSGDGALRWSVDLATGRHQDGWSDQLVVDVSPHAEEEVVLWLTPHTAKAASVVLPGLDGTRWTFSADATWQRWTSEVSVELADGRWLSCRPGPSAPPESEIVVRATRSGLLLGCVTHVDHLGADRPGTTNTWQFNVAAQAVTALPLAA